jgi:hypothetical protein
MIDNKEIKIKIIEAGYIAVERLIKVAQEDIIKPGDDDELSADKLKNAAATKKLAIFDAFDILNRIIAERENIDMVESGPKNQILNVVSQREDQNSLYIELKDYIPKTVLNHKNALKDGVTGTMSSTTW